MKLNILPISILLIILQTLNCLADDNISVVTWQEKSLLNDSGKSSEIFIKARVQNLPKNYRLNSFTFSFGTPNAIQITQTTSDSKPAVGNFSNNNLKINFPAAKKNGDYFTLRILYREKYQKINQFLREEAILIPAFAAGANARVTLSFPRHMESATLNLNLIKNGNSFIYQRIVPDDGVQEIVKLTPSESVWNVTSRVKLKSNQALQKVTVELPDYFYNPRQKVENRNLLSSFIPQEKSKKDGKFILKFDSTEKEIRIEHRAKITTGKNVRKSMNLSPGDYLKIDPQNRESLYNLLQKIKRKPEYQGLPLYAKIGHFTHDFIKYDSRYIGRTPSVGRILQSPVGVCTEYANLFNSLARAAQIPSLAINGMACGRGEKCEGHAWNVIYYQNRWIEVDPTWDLMSGVVSSSHVYFSDDGKQAVGTRYPGDGRVVKLAIETQMENLR